MPTLRRVISRKAKLPDNYKSTTVKEEYVKSQDSAFILIVGPYDTYSFYLSSESSSCTRGTYLSDNETIKDIHPYAFIAKVQR